MEVKKLQLGGGERKKDTEKEGGMKNSKDFQKVIAYHIIF